MSIAFVLLGWILLLATPTAVLLSICMGVLGCLWPISSRVFLAGTASLALMNIAPSSASAADDMTDLMMWAMFSTAPLLGGSGTSLDRKKCPPFPASRFGFAEVGCVTVSCEYHFARFVRDYYVWVACRVVQKLLGLDHCFFCWCCL